MNTGNRTRLIIRRGIFAAVVAALVVFYVAVFWPTSVSGAFLHDVDRAREIAAEKRQPVLMVFSADWCGPCIRMKKETWSDSEIETTLRELLVPVYVDIDEPDGRQWMNHYGVGSIPSIILTDAEGNILQWHTGYRSKVEIQTWLASLENGVESHFESR